MKRLFLIAGIFLLGLSVWYYVRHPLTEKVKIGDHVFNVEVAVTDTEKEKGLGEREALASDAGMLFVYQNKDRYGYWMKGMRFPLDYVWINGNTVVDLSQNIPAPATGQRPVSLAPRVPVDKVLEINAGRIDALGIHIGDTVQFLQ